MQNTEYFEHNGFKKIDDVIIKGGQALAERYYAEAPFKTTKSNCVIVWKQEDQLLVNLKRDYRSALKRAKELMEVEINSIIYLFTDYPKIVKHQIISENPLSDISDYEGKGNISIIGVEDL
jgi:hypothetical protein